MHERAAISCEESAIDAVVSECTGILYAVDDIAGNAIV